MKNVNVNYPHPVLSGANEDYVDCMFKISIDEDATIEGDILKFKTSYTLISNGLIEMIQEGNAKVVLYLECAEALYRQMFTFDSTENSKIIEISKSKIGDKLSVEGYIISNIDNAFFSLPEHNKNLFVAGPSKIRKGDILAISDQNYQIPIDTFDPLSDQKSIFAIRQNPEQKEDITIDITSSEKIAIILSTEMFNFYQKLYAAPETRTILSTLFALPVLVDVLGQMKNISEDFLEEVQSKKWYQVITYRLKTLGISLDQEDSMTEVASRVLSHVFMDVLMSFAKVFDALLEGDSN